MSRRDIADLLLLAMLWGGSFLFMRMAAPEFGAMPMVETRVVVASRFLIVLAQREGKVREMLANWRGIAFVGIANSAIPFTLFAFAILSITAGVGSILNATSPLFGALIAFLWLGDRLPALRVLGLVIGFAGVMVLVGGKPSFEAGGDGWAVVLALAASMSYGIGPNFIKLRLSAVSPLAIATGSQIAASIVVLPLAIAFWPDRPPSAGAWGAAIALGVACTGLAYMLYFRLIANVGPTRAIAVTFLIPAFGMLWGALFLGEPVTAKMIAGCAVVLFGTALATGVIGASAKAKPAGAGRADARVPPAT
jgi:drug/metabolite transporter (DMT)-like permease